MRAVTKKHTAFYLLIGLIGSVYGRSPWRPKDPTLPVISARWSDDDQRHNMTHHCLEYHALFCKFNKVHFDSHLLPANSLSYRNNPNQHINGAELAQMAEGILKEIAQGKKEYTDFIVLKRADFNHKLSTGLLVLKYKNHPFILKLFIKTPATFITQSEGIVPKFFFRMAGGMNRHLAGFTRIPNAEIIKERIAESPKWSKIMEVPRMWYWLPQNPRWITLEGKNIGNSGPCSSTIPAIYGVIADAIEAERVFSLSNKEDCDFGLAFAKYIGNRIDAHVDNLRVEKGTGKIVIIDTEHFPTMVGLKEPMEFNDYKSWYLQLSGKCFKAMYLRTKKARRELQHHPMPELYTLYTPHHKNESA